MSIMTSARIATAMTTVNTSTAPTQAMRQTGPCAKRFGIHGTIGMTIMATMTIIMTTTTIIIAVITIRGIIILMNELRIRTERQWNADHTIIDFNKCI